MFDNITFKVGGCIDMANRNYSIMGQHHKNVIVLTFFFFFFYMC